MKLPDPSHEEILAVVERLQGDLEDESATRRLLGEKGLDEFILKLRATRPALAWFVEAMGARNGAAHGAGALMALQLIEELFRQSELEGRRSLTAR